VVIKAEQPKQEGTIVMPDSHYNPAEFIKGVVVEIGPAQINTTKDPEMIIEVKGHNSTIVKKGEVVLVPQFAGYDLKIDGVQYRLYKESDIAAVLEEEDDEG
jgi:co-chaperonin GroES (HSP10)